MVKSFNSKLSLLLITMAIKMNRVILKIIPTITMLFQDQRMFDEDEDKDDERAPEAITN